MYHNTTLKGISHVGKFGPTEIVRDNLISFFDWGLIDTGGYFNVQIPTSGVYGGQFHKLRSVIDTRYTTGQVWEGFRKNWIWESGLTNTPAPVSISGVNVNGTFYPSNTVGAYSHYINYPLGRIVFNSPIATSATVTAEYSPKLVQVFNLGDIPGLRQVQYGSFRIDDGTFFSSSGNWTIPSENRVQMPALGVVLGGVESYKPFQIGGGQYKYNDVYVHVFTEEEDMGLRLADIISQQKEKVINLYDLNLMNSSNYKTLNHLGSKSSAPKTYPQLVQPSSEGGFAYKSLYFPKSQVLSAGWVNNSLYHSIVKLTTEINLDV